MPNAYQQRLLEHVDRAPGFGRLEADPPRPGSPCLLAGLEASARALVLGRLVAKSGRALTVLTASAEAAEHFYDDFLHFGVENLLYFPMPETLPYEAEEPVADMLARQWRALEALEAWRADGEGSPPVLVAPIEALCFKLPPPGACGQLALRLDWGERLDTEALPDRLLDLGYTREGMAEAPGEFAVRGHIIDIFPPGREHPLRVDLFGDEIESMRPYDPSTQRSLPEVAEIESARILPASLLGLARGLAEGGAELARLDEWLDPEGLLALAEPEKFDTPLERFERLADQRYRERSQPGAAPDTPEFAAAETTPGLDEGLPLPPERLYAGAEPLRRALDGFAQLLLPRLAESHEDAQAQRIDFDVSGYDTIPPDLETYLKLIEQKQRQDVAVHVVCDNEGQARRLAELLGERGLPCQVVAEGLEGATPPADYRPRSVLEGFQDIALACGPMQAGFIFPGAQLLVVTDREIFGRYKRRHIYRKARKGRTLRSASELQRGDLVVHLDHGIGRFLGIRRQDLDGRPTELLELEYAEDNRLLVPIDKVHAVQKYSAPAGEDGARLDRLGGKRWQTRKKKSREEVERLAEELLGLYARRAAARGHAFPPDSVWMREFEEAFLYEETDDQLRAIADCKRDMSGEQPMDRLLCGDVGFGKTEVAMRAAFKCVDGQKQVALLVPTTILAQQHHQTFRERFADFPVRIESVSRFRSPAEVREILAGLKTGEVQIVVGTHRLLSQDVQFADLGLLIVDEEHRFGVKQKEKIKNLRAEVDVLSLSATPIPRTLHMALGGLRDMSTINTPPRDRLPIRTRVIRFVPEEIEAAVMRELNRGGQIYFVHNRVQSIDRVARRLQEIVPEARIAVGHGQMKEAELEQVMLDFIDRKYDILLATTIIESGLDIPNVNTIIINRADAFGLAQLYQLRGRVGRDVRRAYAYLIVPEGQAITDTAVKRLRAIEEFTDLGQGFQVAMRDLEIRGTGNLLGSEQSGTIDAVGFELYCQLLEEAVGRLRGDARSRLEPAEISWPLPALLPAEYVPVESQRVSIYKRCASAREEAELDELAAELRDRYGQLPEPAANLLGIARLRLLAARAGLVRVGAAQRGVKLRPQGDLFDLLARAGELPAALDFVTEVSAEGEGEVLLHLEDFHPEESCDRAAQALRLMAERD